MLALYNTCCYGWRVLHPNVYGHCLSSLSCASVISLRPAGVTNSLSCLGTVRHDEKSDPYIGKDTTLMEGFEGWEKRLIWSEQERKIILATKSWIDWREEVKIRETRDGANSSARQNQNVVFFIIKYKALIFSIFTLPHFLHLWCYWRVPVSTFPFSKGDTNTWIHYTNI